MRPDMNLIVGEFIIMPDYFHAIIMIGENQYNQIPNQNSDSDSDGMHCVSADDPISNQNPDSDANHCVSGNRFGPQSKNLASIIRGFKTGVTTRARTINPKFGWQPRFHDQIIWNARAFRNISNYIKNNPANWNKNKSK